MEPPPPPSPAAPPMSATAQPHPLHHHHPLSYPDSVDSSPRSRNTDSWDEPPAAGGGGGGGRLRLMCSYGGHIVPRPHDKSLCYVGGETRIVVVDRSLSLSQLSAKLSKTLLGGRAFTLKYQLPSEDLDSLISVTTAEDLDNMIDEYDRTAAPTARPSRLRLFLFAAKPESSQSIGPILDNPAKSEDWFLNALNGAAAGMLNRGFSDSASVNCLLGLDDDVGVGNGGNSNSNSGNADPGSREIMEPLQKNSVKQGNFQDIHSVPDSPMLETTSSFGSTSSSPSLANLPPIRVHAEDGGGAAIRGLQDQKAGLIEEQFAQMSVASVAAGGGHAGFSKQDESGGGFAALSSPPTMPLTPAMTSSSSAAPESSAAISIDYAVAGRVISDDERSDHGGVPIGYRKQPPQPLPQKTSGVLDLPSPDSVSSDSSFGNAMSRPKPVVYHQDSIVQIPTTRVSQQIVVDPKLSNISDPNSGYVLQQQFEPKQQSQSQSQSQTQTQQQQQQFVHHGTHYMHHHHPPGTVPISAAYFPVYTSQQQHHHHQIDQQFPVYYVPTRQPQQAYNNNNMSVTQQQQQQQQHNMSEGGGGLVPVPTGHPQPHSNPNSGLVHLPASNSSNYNQVRTAQMGVKPEIGPAPGMYRTGAPSLVQVPSGQQFVSYSHIHHHPMQSIAPTGAVNYTYEYADPGHAQICFSQPLAPPTMGSQYQTMTGTNAATVGIVPEFSGQLSADNMKQQMRTSQPL